MDRKLVQGSPIALETTSNIHERANRNGLRSIWKPDQEFDSNLLSSSLCSAIISRDTTLRNIAGPLSCGMNAFGSPPALINAICHALGVKDVPMPASPYNVWKVAQAAAR